MLSFKPAFSLSPFTFIRRLLSSSSLSAIKVVSSAYLRLLIFLLTILIPVCASSSLAFHMMYCVYKLNGWQHTALTSSSSSLEPVPCYMSGSNCCFFFFFNTNLFILIGGWLRSNIVLVLPYINMNPPQVYTCSPSWTPLPPPYPSHPSGSSQCTSPKHPESCIKPGLAIRFTYDIIHVTMPFSQIIPPLPSPTESKRLFCTSVSLLLSRIQGYHYHLSKFHIYVLVYCIGVFLSGLLHSV